MTDDINLYQFFLYIGSGACPELPGNTALEVRVDHEKNEPEAAEEGSANDARREALKRLGVLGAYTAPAMLMLLHSRASASPPLTSGATN